MDGIADVGVWVAPGRVDCHARDMTFAASAKVTLSGLDSQLVRVADSDSSGDPAAWWLPIDGPGEASIGHLVESDSTGPLRLGFGGWRDLLLGVQFTDGRGRLISAGGRVMKNVAGYDLVKFMVGSRGVFGKVVTIVARAYRRPPLDDGAMAVRLNADIDLTRLSPVPQWCIRTRSGIWVGYIGDAAMVDLATQRIGAIASLGGSVQMIRHNPADDAAMRARLWSPPNSHSAESHDRHTISCRIAIPPGRLMPFILAARIIEWVADPWHGVILTTLPLAELARVEQTARDLGGHLTTSTGHVRRTPAETAVLRRLKAAFDPDGNLPPLEPLLELTT